MNKSIILMLFVAFLSSCESFLDEDSRSYITQNNFYRNNDEAIAAVNSVYATMRNEAVLLPFLFLNELTTDDVTLPSTTTGERLELENLVYSSEHIYIEQVWKNSYNAINRANVVLQYVDSSLVTPKLTRRIYAEALFLRAFHHFRLVRWFGDIPLMTKPTESTEPESLFPSRASTIDVYEQIIEDLKYAEINLDDKYVYTSPDYYRATKGAAKSLLAKVYLTMSGYPVLDESKWVLATEKCEEIIMNKSVYGYDLMDNLSDIFSPAKESTNTENIFVLPGTTRLSIGGWYYTRMHMWYFGWASLRPTFETYGIDSYNTLSIWGANSSERNDLRRKVALGRKMSNTLIQDIDHTSGTVVITKYLDMENTSDAQNDYPFIRYTDIYYMYAEALMESGVKDNMDKAIDIINNFRKRAGVPDLSYSNQSDLREIIRQERRKEFLFEGHRWTDLVRWGNFVSVMKAHGSKQYVSSDRFNPENPTNPLLHVAERNTLFPLPLSEWSANPNLRPQNFDY